MELKRKRSSVANMADPQILVAAIVESFKKLDPRLLIRNPVIKDLPRGRTGRRQDL
ncbi:MAG: hypothetical protein ACREEI_11355 [Stellaceae bacterium]